MDQVVEKPSPTEEIIIEERITKVNGDFYIKKYAMGKFLGKGGFAKVYNFTNLENGKILAGKVIPKANLNRSRAKQKLMIEIRLHKTLFHNNIVKFEHVFEDGENVYILLELCTNQTMSELIKRRRRLSEFEVRCYIVQIVEALKYLHGNRIIHRDLKLGNMFLSEKMEIKLGDFGLAAKLEFDGEKKRTVCGTPNYLAPEVLEGKGHSYEVDLWSLGVIIYTIIIGKPPFETDNVKNTYKRIKVANFVFPEFAYISTNAKNLITKLLVVEPEKRLTLDEILKHPFITDGGPIPKLLPVSTLACPPPANFVKQFANLSTTQKGIRITTDAETVDINDILKSARGGSISTARYSGLKTPNDLESPRGDMFKIAPKTARFDLQGSDNLTGRSQVFYNKLFPMQSPTRRSMTRDFTNIRPFEEAKIDRTPKKAKDDKPKEKEIADVKVVKFYDYTAKYGLGYALSNGTVGVSFNDGSKLFAPKGEKFQYIVRNSSDKSEVQNAYTFQDYPKDLHKKVLVYQKFKEQFELATKNPTSQDISVYVKKWMNTKHAILFRMNNKVMQSAFKDGSEMILNSESKKLTFVDLKGVQHVCSLDDARSSSNKELVKRLKYVEEVLKCIWNVQTETLNTYRSQAIDTRRGGEDCGNEGTNEDLNQKFMLSHRGMITSAEREVN